MAGIRVTLDTNILPAPDLESAAVTRGVSIAVVGVTERETNSTSYSASSKLFDRVMETMVLDESPFDGAILAGEEDAETFETVLRVISNGSFPRGSARNNLNHRQHNQLRGRNDLRSSRTG